jgi:GNAT superfamily N-acetyltransferase
MNVKACTTEDIGELIRVSIQSYQENYTYLWLDKGEGYVRDNFNFDKLYAEMANANSVFFLVYWEQKAVGYIKLNIDKGIDGFSAGESLELERIYFVREASGKGLGKGAIDFVMNFAKQRGKLVVWLKTMDSSDALDFYKKRGFEIIGETRVSFPNIIEEYSGMYVMVLPLSTYRTGNWAPPDGKTGTS